MEQKDTTIRPQLAIIGHNTLQNEGLKSLLEKMIPFVHVDTYFDMEEMTKTETVFFHYFVDAQEMMSHLPFFQAHRHQTIVLLHGKKENIPSDYHQVNVNLPLQSLLKEFLVLEQSVHRNDEKFPSDIVKAMKACETQNSAVLTPRETEVLKDVAVGKSSKEIAELRHISLSTVLTHRKNIMEKLGTHSATKLVIYAVTHGLISAEDISIQEE